MTKKQSTRMYNSKATTPSSRDKRTPRTRTGDIPPIKDSSTGLKVGPTAPIMGEITHLLVICDNARTFRLYKDGVERERMAIPRGARITFVQEPDDLRGIAPANAWLVYVAGYADSPMYKNRALRKYWTPFVKWPM